MFARLLITFLLFFISITPLESSEGEGEGKKKSEGSKDDKKKKSSGHGEHGKEEAPKVVNPADLYSEGPVYVHKWIDFPNFQASTLEGETLKVKALKGKSVVVVFLASWCTTCQDMIPKILTNEKKHTNTKVVFYYVFAHDTQPEAHKFMEHFHMDAKRSMLDNHEVLKAFHNPELPSIYISDRDGFLLDRYLKVNEKDLLELDEILTNLELL